MRFGKIAAVLVGVVALLAGFGSTMVGGGILAVTDAPDGSISAPSFGVNTENVALLADDIEIWVEPDLRTPGLFVDAFKVTARADSRNGKDIFIGVGLAQDVRAYLGDTDPDRVLIDNDELMIEPGTSRAPLAPPVDQAFWEATNVGGDFEWRPATGEWALVVMNADGTPGIDTVLDVEAAIPFLRPVAAVLFGLGIFGLGIGAFLLYLGVRSQPRAAEPPAPPRQPVEVA